MALARFENLHQGGISQCHRAVPAKPGLACRPQQYVFKTALDGALSGCYRRIKPYCSRACAQIPCCRELIRPVSACVLHVIRACTSRKARHNCTGTGGCSAQARSINSLRSYGVNSKGTDDFFLSGATTSSVQYHHRSNGTLAAVAKSHKNTFSKHTTIKVICPGDKSDVLGMLSAWFTSFASISHGCGHRPG